MPTYMSPDSFNQPTAPPVQGTVGTTPLQGGIQGIIDGLKFNQQQAVVNQGLQSGDLANAIQATALAKANSDLTVTQANNPNLVSGAGVTAGMYASGAMQGQAQSAVAANTAGSDASTVGSNVKRIMAVGPIMAGADQQISARPGFDPNTNDEDKAIWNNIRRGMIAAGVNNVPLTFGPNDAATIHSSAQAYFNSPTFLQQQSLLNTKVSGDKAVEAQRAAAGVQEAGIRGAATVQAATINSSSRETVAQIGLMAMKKAGEDFQNTLALATKKGAGTGMVDPDFVDQLRNAKFMEVWNSPTYDTFRSIQLQPQTPQNDQIIQQAQQRAKDDANRQLAALPSVRKAMAVHDAQGGPSSATPGGPAAPPGGGSVAPKDSMQTAVESMGGTYQPDKFNYRINPATGKPQSSPK